MSSILRFLNSRAVHPFVTSLLETGATFTGPDHRDEEDYPFDVRPLRTMGVQPSWKVFLELLLPVDLCRADSKMIFFVQG